MNQEQQQQQQQQLLSLRAKIVESALPLILDGNGAPEERFDFLLNIIRAGSANGELFTKAYELAMSIEQPDQKLPALLGLLEEVQYGIDSNGTAATQLPPADVNSQNNSGVVS